MKRMLKHLPYCSSKESIVWHWIFAGISQSRQWLEGVDDQCMRLAINSLGKKLWWLQRRNISTGRGMREAVIFHAFACFPRTREYGGKQDATNINEISVITHTIFFTFRRSFATWVDCSLEAQPELLQRSSVLDIKGVLLKQLINLK